MLDEKWSKVEQIFNQAVLLPAAERRLFVEECSDDPEIRGEVITLLDADQDSEKIFQDSVFPLVAQLLDDDFTLLRGKSNFASYVLQVVLGRGGMGTVYLAHDTRLERPVAIKVLPSTLASKDDVLARFRHEAKAASSISHQNVAHVYEFGSHEGLHFLAMEYVAGKTLRELLRENEIDLQKAVEIALQIAKALRAAHKAGITHRDIKPENVIITDECLVKVLDFGLAKLSDKSNGNNQATLQTHPGLIIGTTAYMSPEQIRAGKIDERTDLWSLGVTFYEMLAGHRPFAGDTISDVQAAVLLKEPSALPVSSNLPSLEKIARKALSKDISERYQSADEIIIDLQQAQRDVYDFVHQNKSGNVAGSISAVSGSLNKKEITAENSVRKRKTSLVLRGGILAFITLLAGGVVYYENQSGIFRRDLSVKQSLRINTEGKPVRAALAKNGEWLAYALEENGKHGLFLRRNDSQVGINGIKTLVAPADVRFGGIAFSPDGEFVYYAARAVKEVYFSLYRVPTAGGGAQKILDEIENVPSFSPDGKQVVFLRLSRDDSYEALIVADADGANQRVLHKREMPDFITHLASPAWSPDGQTIVCSVGTYGENKVQKVFPLAIRVSDGQAKNVFPEPWAEIWHTAWVPDGSGFVMSGRIDKSYDNKQLWLVSYPEGKITRLTNDFNDYYGVSVAKSNGGWFQLSTLILERSAGLWISDLSNANANALQLTEGSDDGFGVSWTKQNGIVYGSMTGGNPDIWTVNPDRTEKRRLTEDARADMYPSVTPDGKFIVFISEKSGVKSLWRADRDGSNQTLLAQGASAQPFALTPDGKYVYYHSYFDGATALWRVAVAGGEPEKIYSGRAELPAVSPDGKMIVTTFQPEGINELRLVVRSTDNPSQILYTLTPPDDINISAAALTPLRWTPDGRSIAYVVMKNNIGNIWAQSIDGGEPKPLTNFTNLRIYSFDWSPDGRQIVCSRGEQSRYLTLLQLN